MSKYKRSGRPQSSRWKRTTRPRLEVLESRLVLSTISGTVFNDLHVTGAIAADDPGLANRTVFVDLHNDGVLALRRPVGGHRRLGALRDHGCEPRTPCGW